MKDGLRIRVSAKPGDVCTPASQSAGFVDGDGVKLLLSLLSFVGAAESGPLRAEDGVRGDVCTPASDMRLAAVEARSCNVTADSRRCGIAGELTAELDAEDCAAPFDFLGFDFLAADASGWR